MARNDFGTSISPALYSGGAVNVNTQPFMNYYLQSRARQQAQDDSLLKYYGDLGKNLTPSGMHSSDVDDLVKMKTDWQNFGMQNKKTIDRPSLDGGRSYRAFMSKYNDMQGLIAESKDKVKNLASLHPVVMDPAKRGRLTQSTLDNISAAELPVRHPGYKPIDFNSINYSDKPFDLTDQGKLTGILTRIKGSEAVDNIVPDKKTGMQTVTYKNSFSPDQLNGMTNIAHTLYHNHPGFKELIDKEADPLSNNYDQLNETFKQHYGRDIGDGEDMATAHVLSMNPNRAGRQITQKTPVNPMDMLNAREASQKRLIDYRQANKSTSDKYISKDIDDLFDKMISTSKTEPAKSFISKEGDVSYWHSIPMTDATKKLFSYTDVNKNKILPDEVHSSNDGKTIKPLFFKKDEAGNNIPDPKVPKHFIVDEDHSKPALVEEFKARFKKDLGGVKMNQKPASIQSHANTEPAKTIVPPIKTTKTKLPKNAFD